MTETISLLCRRVLPAPVIQWLRGEHNSVRYRFWLAPKERASLALHRLRGRSYFEWYAKRLDGFVAVNRERKGEAADQERFRNYMESGSAALETLRKLGLQPHHSFHDFGMGFGRVGQFVMQYLEPGHYSGNDASRERIAFGMEYAREKGIDVEALAPTLIVSTDNSFDWLEGKRFDYILAMDVFTHMPPEDIEEVIRNVRKAMHKDSAFLFTYTKKEELADSVKRLNVKDWWHNDRFFEDLADKHGYAFEDVSRFEPRHVMSTRFVKLTLKA